MGHIYGISVFGHCGYCVFFAARFCAATIQGWMLFEGDVYFFGKPADINNDRIRYMGAIHWQLLDAISSMHSLSVLLSTIEASHTTLSVLSLVPRPCAFIACSTKFTQSIVVTVVSNCSHTMTYMCATYTGHMLFEGNVYFTQSFQLCSYYSRSSSIQRNTVTSVNIHILYAAVM